MRNKRRVNAFSLSFLDIMACGFGAVTLLFLILKHDTTTAPPAVPDQSAEVALLDEDIRVGKEDLAALKNTLKEVEDAVKQAQGKSNQVILEIQNRKKELSAQTDAQQDIATLRKKLAALQKEKTKLAAKGSDSNVRAFVGEGQRQYLTGLKLGGRRVLILVDASASMLSDRIVNVIRLRNMSKAKKLQAEKWRRAIRTVEWLVAQLPAGSQYQLYTFNTKAKSVTGDFGKWRNTDRLSLDKSITQLKQVAPEGGTSLVNAFQSISSFSSKPDNIFLLTDGLPTQGRKPPKQKTISGKQRLQFFADALGALPIRIPVNTLLFPMEGDPAAAGSFWQLALTTDGSFLSPSRDWP